MTKDRQSSSCRITVRFTPAQRSHIESAANGMPVSEFARDRILSDCPEKPKPRRRSPTKELEAAGRILGELGRTRIASNLNQVAKQANAGSLVIAPELQTALLAACADIRQIRNLLLKMQGLSKAHDE